MDDWISVIFGYQRVGSYSIDVVAMRGLLALCHVLVIELRLSLLCIII